MFYKQTPSGLKKQMCIYPFYSVITEIRNAQYCIFAVFSNETFLQLLANANSTKKPQCVACTLHDVMMNDACSHTAEISVLCCTEKLHYHYTDLKKKEREREFQ